MTPHIPPDMEQLPDDHQPPRIGVDASSYGLGDHDNDEDAISRDPFRFIGPLLGLALIIGGCVVGCQMMVAGNG